MEFKRPVRADFRAALQHPGNERKAPRADEVIEERCGPIEEAAQPAVVPAHVRSRLRAAGQEPTPLPEALRAAASSSGYRGAGSRLKATHNRNVIAANVAKAEAPPEVGSVSFKEKEMRQAFTSLDIGQTGAITAAKLRHIFSQLGEMPRDQEIAAMIRMLDPSNEGKVNADNFIACFVKPAQFLRTVNRRAVTETLDKASEHSSTEDEEELPAEPESP